MSYSRRTFLRDASFVSVGGGVGALSMKYFSSGTATIKMATAGTPFKDGIRIFFAGSWLFASDPTKTGYMRAMSLDLPGKPHDFRYGKWAPGFDSQALTLVKNPKGNRPHTITLTGYSSPALATIDPLFKATRGAYTFTYLTNPQVQGKPTYYVNDALAEIRIISIPIPATIIPAAFYGGASLADNSSRHNLSTTNPKLPIQGVATTHIFDYPGATSLSFTTSNANSGSAAKNDHYHFHTVPQAPNHTPQAMFANLQQLLGLTVNKPDLVLNGVADDTGFVNPQLPDCILTEELEEPDAVRLTLASCAGGAIGLGDCC